MILFVRCGSHNEKFEEKNEGNAFCTRRERERELENFSGMFRNTKIFMKIADVQGVS